MSLRKILIVDDSATERQHLAHIIASAGYAVVAASSGREALEAVRRERPDAVLLDVVMSDMNGFEVCRAITSDSATCAIPVVLVSSKGEKTDRLWAAAQGARAYITNPYSTERILAELASLDRARAESASIDP